MRQILKRIVETLVVIFGNCIYAFGIAMFILPSGLITGGTTGIALFVNDVFHTPVTVFVFVFNTIMFLIGFFAFGWKFAANTIVSTFSYPIALELITRLLGGYRITDDLILCTVFGGICIGAAIGLVIRMGASTGGMDIPPLILNKYFKIPVSSSIYVFDMLILLLQVFHSTGEQVLYGILLVILKDIDRGVTLLNSETGFLRNNTMMLLTVVSMRELAKTEKLIHEVDPDAFVIINKVSEVSGRGFSSKKRYLKQTGDVEG